VLLLLEPWLNDHCHQLGNSWRISSEATGNGERVENLELSNLGSHPNRREEQQFKTRHVSKLQTSQVDAEIYRYIDPDKSSEVYDECSLTLSIA
jgi:hypothetical protein